MTQVGAPYVGGNPYYPQPMAGGAGALPPDSYTPWGKRVAATLIDGLPAGAIMGFGALAAAGGSDMGLVIYLMCILAAAGFFTWNQCYRQGVTGSSIGKSAMKVKVVAEQTGQPIGFGKEFVRQLAHFADAATCYVGYLFPLWDPKRQTFADKIMSTVCLPIGSTSHGGGTPAQLQPNYQLPQQAPAPQPYFPQPANPQQYEPHQPGGGSAKPYRPSY